MKVSFKLGVGARLGIAFLAVVALAVAANLLMAHRTSIVRTTEIQSVVPAAAPAAVRIPVPVSTPTPVPQVSVIEQAELGLAIGHFGNTVILRSSDNSTQAAAQMRTADLALQRATSAALAKAVPSPHDKQLRTLTKQLKTQREHARELVNIADGRHTLVVQYRQRFEALDRRMQQSLNGAWKMLGRVIARQSLMELSQDLDAIRWQLSTFVVPDGYSAANVRAVQESEAAFARKLEENERGLIRSQGEDWVKQMRADMASLASVRASLLTNDERQRSGLERFAKENMASVELMRSMMAAQAKAIAKESSVATAPPHAAPAAAPVGTPKLAVGTPHSVTKSSESAAQSSGDISQRRLIAAISAVVLLLLSIVVIWTVRNHTSLESKVEQRTRELQELAEKDSLTALPNRRQLFVLLDAALVEAQRKGHQVGVFFLDLDNFKNINDGMGHAYGDQVLKEVAKRLSGVIQGRGFAARLGGDEFTVVLPAAQGIEQIQDVGRELVRAFQQALSVANRDLMLSVSVGASVFPEHESDGAGLLRAADVALFRAKALGRNQLALFTADLLEAAASKFATEQGLRRALQHGEFELVFQPEIGVETLETLVVEALIRWRLPDGRYVSPGEFLPVAEESGLIMDISDWVLRSAIQTAAQWHHGPWPQVRVAINISSRQLFDNRFVDRVQDLLREFHLPARCIEIELTETVLQTGPATIQTLKTLREQGFAIALDDFGTGYSSLASLEQLPLTRVKLDRSLIASIDESPRSAAIAAAIISLCRNLGLDITAEGIERPEQLALLLPHRDLCLQGYLLSRPVAANDLPSVLNRMPAHLQSILLSSPALQAHRALPPPAQHPVALPDLRSSTG